MGSTNRNDTLSPKKRWEIAEERAQRRVTPETSNAGLYVRIEEELRRLGASEEEVREAIEDDLRRVFKRSTRMMQAPADPSDAGAKWIADMRARVHGAVAATVRGSRRRKALGALWADEIGRISRDLDALFAVIHQDIFGEPDAQLHTLALAELALGYATFELKSPSMKRSEQSEPIADVLRRCRDAVLLFSQEGDSTDGRRVAAIRVAQTYASPKRWLGGKWSLDEMPLKDRRRRAEIDKDFARDPEGSLERDRQWWGAMVRHFLTEASPAFDRLPIDTIVTTFLKGDPRWGPIRRLAALSVAAGAFGDDQTSIPKAAGAYKVALSRERARAAMFMDKKPKRKSDR